MDQLRSSITTWWYPQFDIHKTKAFLGTAILRIRLKTTKALEDSKKRERELYSLLTGEGGGNSKVEQNVDMAKVRVEQLINDKKLRDAYDVLEFYCQTVTSRIGTLALKIGTS